MELVKSEAPVTAAPVVSFEHLSKVDQRIEWTAVEALKPCRSNARTHTIKQIRQIARSIERFGFVNPVLIDEQGEIIAGHGRVEAAKVLGLAEIPTLRYSHLSGADKRAYRLADNKLALNAGWDPEILSIEIEGLIELGFDIELTGFETAEIDLILDGAEDADGESASSADDTTNAVSGPTICQLGDLWQLGDHRVICGNARDAATYEQLLNGEKAVQVFSDPPYNVRIGGNVCGLGSIQHREFAMASGEMSSEEFTDFLKCTFQQLAANSIDGSIHHLFMDWRHMKEMLAAGSANYTELKNLCIWNKTNAGMGSFYRSQHELVFVWKSGTAAHINNFELGQHGRHRSNVWTYPGNHLDGSRSDGGIIVASNGETCRTGRRRH